MLRFVHFTVVLRKARYCSLSFFGRIEVDAVSSDYECEDIQSASVLLCTPKLCLNCAMSRVYFVNPSVGYYTEFIILFCIHN